jgi:hypothetical protein
MNAFRGRMSTSFGRNLEGADFVLFESAIAPGMEPAFSSSVDVYLIEA